MAQTPSQGAAKYQIAISGTPTTSTFALSATPVGSMATDECGTFTIDQSGLKTAAAASTGALYTKCWK
jgi:type IV pilus assembly protein PilE